MTAVMGGEGRIWLNDGLGAFEPTEQRLGPFSSRRVSLADIDGDGDLDAFFAVLHEQPNALWLNNGDGSFFSQIQWIGNTPSMTAALGDLDGDGDLDAFIANTYRQPDRVWLNESAKSSIESAH